MSLHNILNYKAPFSGFWKIPALSLKQIPPLSWTKELWGWTVCVLSPAEASPITAFYPLGFSSQLWSLLPNNNNSNSEKLCSRPVKERCCKSGSNSHSVQLPTGHCFEASACATGFSARISSCNLPARSATALWIRWLQTLTPDLECDAPNRESERQTDQPVQGMTFRKGTASVLSHNDLFFSFADYFDKCL